MLNATTTGSVNEDAVAHVNQLLDDAKSAFSRFSNTVFEHGNDAQGANSASPAACPVSGMLRYAQSLVEREREQNLVALCAVLNKLSSFTSTSDTPVYDTVALGASLGGSSGKLTNALERLCQAAKYTRRAELVSKALDDLVLSPKLPALLYYAVGLPDGLNHVEPNHDKNDWPRAQELFHSARLNLVALEPYFDKDELEDRRKTINELRVKLVARALEFPNKSNLLRPGILGSRARLLFLASVGATAPYVDAVRSKTKQHEQNADDLLTLCEWMDSEETWFCLDLHPEEKKQVLSSASVLILSAVFDTLQHRASMFHAPGPLLPFVHRLDKLNNLDQEGTQDLMQKGLAPLLEAVARFPGHCFKQSKEKIAMIYKEQNESNDAAISKSVDVIKDAWDQHEMTCAGLCTVELQSNVNQLIHQVVTLSCAIMEPEQPLLDDPKEVQIDASTDVLPKTNEELLRQLEHAVTVYCSLYLHLCKLAKEFDVSWPVTVQSAQLWSRSVVGQHCLTQTRKLQRSTNSNAEDQVNSKTPFNDAVKVHLNLSSTILVNLALDAARQYYPGIFNSASSVAAQDQILDAPSAAVVALGEFMLQMPQYVVLESAIRPLITCLGDALQRDFCESAEKARQAGEIGSKAQFSRDASYFAQIITNLGCTPLKELQCRCQT